MVSRRKKIDRMKADLFGHPVGYDEDGPSKIDYTGSPLLLREVSIVAEPKVLREIAIHLIEAAYDMEQNDNFDHSHWRSRIGIPDVVVCRPTKET